jgi:hypothetical protein
LTRLRRALRGLLVAAFLAPPVTLAAGCGGSQWPSADGVAHRASQGRSVPVHHCREAARNGRGRVYVCDGRLVVGNDDHGLGIVYDGDAPAHPTARQIRDEIRRLLPELMDHAD